MIYRSAHSDDFVVFNFVLKKIIKDQLYQHRDTVFVGWWNGWKVHSEN